MKPLKEFHVSRQARQRYQFDEALFAQSGNVIFTNFNAARRFTQQINDRLDLVNFPDRAVRAGQVNAMGLVDEILHLLIDSYRREVNPLVLQEALAALETALGRENMDQVLSRFAEEFPPLAVYRNQLSVAEYLAGTTQGISNREFLFEELLMLWLENINPAFAPFLELFDDSTLEQQTDYLSVFPLLQAFFDTQPGFGPENQNLIDLLRTPAIKFPYSLSEQLAYMRGSWTSALGTFIFRMLSSLDLIREEEKPIFGTGGGEGVPISVADFSAETAEPEAFSPDLDWMPSLVLIAKNSYVWLDQLSRKYQHPINRLDQIPDQELDRLARWGITGLWLIGLWERSPASQRIKQMRGNPEAVASAYSLMDYQIAGDLGGEQAFQGLRERAWRRGIRLASDMVPNHMGIDSRWVIEHPDWFISLPEAPFPSYSFNGPNLSWDNRVGLYLEDHYYDNSDAAVVFKRVDFWTGDTRYIYHGNDGTAMPWNDTAQLNYLMPEVREAVIQTILHVARKFSVIRFDAAMTLAKKHFQRLWYPEPGSGGDIPSRAGLGLTKEQFDAAIPVEFWRELVDRVAQEVPDTLLLAEAFWLMEGYFVRTLGMHRVYNSAFMNMLRDEKNAEYRLVIKNTLEFDPEILKRYVNFMNNPDERTAVDQFGKGDKYFGICTLMATLPGLPMLGHGQVEGFTEKYGMEYRRAYWEEQSDDYLVERHERQIFPLFRRRYLFAEVENFLLYDFFTHQGGVNEDVFTYSNRRGENRSLVIYHNRYATARGWLNTSAAYAVKDGGGNRNLVQKSLAEGLGLENRADMFTIFRDYVTGFEYIRSNRELHDQGFYIELEAYAAHVYLDIRQVVDDDLQQYGRLAGFLNGDGVPSIEEAARELFLQPIHTPFKELVNPGMLNWLTANLLAPDGIENPNLSKALVEAEEKILDLLVEIEYFIGSQAGAQPLTQDIHRKLTALLNLPALPALYPDLRKGKYKEALAYLRSVPETDMSEFSPAGNSKLIWSTLLIWVFLHLLGNLSGQDDPAATSRAWIDEFLFGKLAAASLKELGMTNSAAQRAILVTQILISHQGWWQSMFAPARKRTKPSKPQVEHGLLSTWLADPDVQRYINVNQYQGIVWFNKESFEELLWWFFVTALVDVTAAAADPSKQISGIFATIQQFQQAGQASGYQVDRLLAYFNDPSRKANL